MLITVAPMGMVRRRRFSSVLSAVSSFSLGVSGVLFTSRFVPSDGLPARSDTAAMLSAFTDFAAPGLIVATALALAALALRDDRPRKVLVVVCLAASVIQVVVLVPRWTTDPVVAHHGSFAVLALNSRLAQADPTAQPRRTPKPPSKFVRGIAWIGLPLGALLALLALADIAALIYNLVEDRGSYRILLSVGQAVFFGAIAYSVGIEVPRNVRAWDAALAERRQLGEQG